MAEYDHLPEAIRAFAVSVLGDDYFPSDALEELRDARLLEPSFSISPHIIKRVGTREVQMSDNIVIWDLSRPLHELGRMPQGPLMWSWAQQCQDITVLALGAQDLIQGTWSKDFVLRDRTFWENMFKRIAEQMVEIKSTYYARVGRQNELEKWTLNHRFAFYPLPWLPDHVIEAGGHISAEDYKECKRVQWNQFRKKGVNSVLRREHNILLLKPNPSDPELEDGCVPPSVKREYVKHLLGLVTGEYCARCGESRINNGVWGQAVFRSLQEDQACALQTLPQEMWDLIFSKLTLFDLYRTKLACRAFYKVCRGSLFFTCAEINDTAHDAFRHAVQGPN